MAKFPKSRTELYMEETKANVQFQSIPLRSLEETMTPKAISNTKYDIKIEQHPHWKEMSIRELMVHQMNEEKKMAEMSFEKEQRRLPTILEVNLEEEMEYYKDPTVKNDGELEKLQIVENVQMS